MKGQRRLPSRRKRMPRPKGIDGYVRWGAKRGAHADARLVIAGLDRVLERLGTHSKSEQTPEKNRGCAHVNTCTDGKDHIR